MENTTETLVENEVIEITETEIKVDGRHNNKGRNPKNYTVHNNNKNYLEGYLASLSPVSMPQYRVNVYPFLSGLDQKALHNTKAEDIESFFVSLGENEKKISSAKIHISSLYKWARNNVPEFKTKIHRSVLDWLID